MPVTDPDPFVAQLIRSGVPIECEIPCADCDTPMWVPCGCEYYGYTDCYHLCDPCLDNRIERLYGETA